MEPIQQIPPTSYSTVQDNTKIPKPNTPALDKIEQVRIQPQFVQGHPIQNTIYKPRNKPKNIFDATPLVYTTGIAPVMGLRGVAKSLTDLVIRQKRENDKKKLRDLYSESNNPFVKNTSLDNYMDDGALASDNTRVDRTHIDLESDLYDKPITDEQAAAAFQRLANKIPLSAVPYEELTPTERQQIDKEYNKTMWELQSLEDKQFALKVALGALDVADLATTVTGPVGWGLKSAVYGGKYIAKQALKKALTQSIKRYAAYTAKKMGRYAVKQGTKGLTKDFIKEAAPNVVIDESKNKVFDELLANRESEYYPIVEAAESSMGLAPMIGLKILNKRVDDYAEDKLKQELYERELQKQRMDNRLAQNNK